MKRPNFVTRGSCLKLLMLVPFCRSRRTLFEMLFQHQIRIRHHRTELEKIKFLPTDSNASLTIDGRTAIQFNKYRDAQNKRQNERSADKDEKNIQQTFAFDGVETF